MRRLKLPAVVRELWDLPDQFLPRPVSLSSPFPPQECLERLTKVATTRGASWYLDPKTAVLPDPRLRLYLGPSGIRAACFQHITGRNNFVPWLSARIEPGPERGTVLTGTVSPWDGSAGLVRAMIVLSGLMLLGGLIGGTAALVADGPVSVIRAFLVPLVIGISGMLIQLSYRKTLPRQITELIQEVNDILGSTAQM